MAIKNTIRIRPMGKLQEKILTRGTAIHYHCVECCGYNTAEVALCPSKHCALYAFRTGSVDPAFKEVPDTDAEIVGDDVQTSPDTT